jgi:hypothetical protein
MLSTQVVAANRTAIAAQPATVPRGEVACIEGFSLIPRPEATVLYLDLTK